MHRIVRAAAVTGTAGLLAAGVLAGTVGSASAGTSPARHAASAVAHLPLSARQMLTDQQLHARAADATGSVTGIAQSASGQPLADVCVDAYGPSGERFAVTGTDGRYFIPGLRPGSYYLRYDSCGSSRQYLTQWYGGAAQRAGSRPVVVAQSALRQLAPVTLRAQAGSLAGLRTINVASPATELRSVLKSLGLADAGTRAQQSLAASAAVEHTKDGRISGLVTAPDGSPLKGICVEAGALTGDGFASTSTGKNGQFLTRKIPAGSYYVVFAPGCGNDGNWLLQIYKDASLGGKPTKVHVVAGQTTTGIDAVMKLGGEISGVVTNAAGRKLSNICPVAIMQTADSVFGYIGLASRGTYHLTSLPPGSYRIEFIPCTATSPYVPVWWHNALDEGKAKVLHVKSGTLITGVDQVMRIGGTITGTVTNSSDQPLAGICAQPYQVSSSADVLSFSGEIATNAAGEYKAEGLAPGTYQVQFSTGCGNNSNYTPVTSGSIKIEYGRTVTGVDAVMPLGGTIRGTVTSAATGAPLAGICVYLSGTPATFFGDEARTGASGTYRFDQLPVGTYYVQFAGGCGNAGSYAPQGYGSPTVFAPAPLQVTAPDQGLSGIDAAMQPGATLTGTVTSSSGAKLSGVCALVGSEAVGAVGEGTSRHGTYVITNVLPGDYQVAFVAGCNGPGGSDLATVYFKSLSSLAAPLVSAGPGTTSGIDAVLPTGGAISGKIRTAAGNGVDLACIFLTGLSGKATADTGEALVFGEDYEFSGLLPGSYTVAFVPDCAAGNHYANQWFKNRPSPAGAAKLAVRAGHTISGITSALADGGSIAGTITSGGAPVSEMCVFAQSTTQFLDFGEGRSNAAGKYVVRGLNSGRYELELQPCGKASADYAASLPSRLVRVTAPAGTSGVNFTASLGGTISGQVLGGSPAVAQPEICVDAFGVSTQIAGSALTTQNGTFQIQNLPPGTYLVYLNDLSCSQALVNLAPVWYPDAATEQSGTEVTVTASAVTTLSSVTLPSNGSITGSVRGQHRAALAGACVVAYSVAGTLPPVYAVTGSNGTYSIIGLVPGTYQVEFGSGCGASGYKSQWWHDHSTRGTANYVAVQAGTATTGISATLKK